MPDQSSRRTTSTSPRNLTDSRLPRRPRTDATELISDLPARDNPRVRLARDQCIPPGALLTGGLGKAKI